MLSFVDSTPIAHDGESLRLRLEVDGYLFFKGLLDPDVLTSVRRDILTELAELGWTEPGSDPSDARPGDVPRFEAGPGWWEGYRAVQSLESFHRLAHNPTIVKTFATLFGEDVMVHPQKIARVIFPQHPGATTPAHQDFPNLGGTLDVFTMWVPLADTPTEQGGLRIRPGSHREGCRPITFDTTKIGAPSIEAVGDFDDQGWATVDYQAGDVVVFHSLLVHAGIPNVSDRIRVSVDFRYQPVSEPVATWAVSPHFFERPMNLPSWEEFTGGWSTTAWREVPDGTTVIAAPVPLVAGTIGPHAGAHAGMSRFFDSSAFAEQVADETVLVSVLSTS